MYGKEIKQLLQDLAWVDDVTYYHSLRVGYIMSRFAETEMGKKFVKQAWVTRNEFVATGLLHDIGKLRWSRDVLIGPEQYKGLDQEAIVKVWTYLVEHPISSQDIILDYYKRTGNRFWERIAVGVAGHHENYCGDGYPYRLQGLEIPLLARGLRVFDHYISQVETRRMNKPQEPNIVLREMRMALGIHFDPFWGEKIVDFLTSCPCLPGNLDVWLEEELTRNFSNF